MDIQFRTKKLERECNEPRLCVKAHGPDRAARLKRRLDALRAADCLEDLRNAPGRLHELGMNRKGQLSMDLDHPYRLIFTAAAEPAPVKADGGLDWARVTAVTITGIEDTHE